MFSELQPKDAVLSDVDWALANRYTVVRDRADELVYGLSDLCSSAARVTIPVWAATWHQEPAARRLPDDRALQTYGVLWRGVRPLE